MKYSTSLKLSLKYHLLALLPLVVGGGVAVAGIWIGVIDPMIVALEDIEPEMLLTGGFIHNADINPWLGSTGALGGYLIHRVGRTALLMRIHGSAVESNAKDSMNDHAAEQPSHRAVATAPINPAPGDDSAEQTGEVSETNPEDASSVEDDAEPDELEPAEMIESIKDDLDVEDVSEE